MFDDCLHIFPERKAVCSHRIGFSVHFVLTCIYKEWHTRLIRLTCKVYIMKNIKQLVGLD